jgi:hypothetical protein
VAYLESCNQMSPRDLMDADGAPGVMDKYLSKFTFRVHSPFVCFSFISMANPFFVSLQKICRRSLPPKEHSS